MVICCDCKCLLIRCQFNLLLNTTHSFVGPFIVAHSHRDLFVSIALGVWDGLLVCFVELDKDMENNRDNHKN
ncbi:hypothetical protein SCA6_002983 [Theobroma cacao]